MNDKDFRDLVAKMRTAQKSYFRTRAKDPVKAREILAESKRLEAKVDNAIQQGFETDNGQKELFE